MIIFAGPSGPKLSTEALVVSEKVGDDGRGETSRLGEIVWERRERTRGIVQASRYQVPNGIEGIGD